jgi:hypothetical protein
MHPSVLLRKMNINDDNWPTPCQLSNCLLIIQLHFCGILFILTGLHKCSVLQCIQVLEIIIEVNFISSSIHRIHIVSTK